MKKENRQLLRLLHKDFLQKKYPSVPSENLPIYEPIDTKANKLTSCIIDFLKWNKHHAERINNISRMVNGKFIKSSMQRGTADISATIGGRSVKIEIKIGNDKQSEYQKRYQQDILDAGGFYFIATSFDDFITWYNNTFKHQLNCK